MKFKKAMVIHLYKSGDSTDNDPSNYLPISILSLLSTPLEKQIQTHLSSHLSNNDLIHGHQSAFWDNHSCHTALTRLVDKFLPTQLIMNLQEFYLLTLPKLLTLSITLFFLKSYWLFRTYLICHLWQAATCWNKLIQIGIPFSLYILTTCRCTLNVYVNYLPMTLPFNRTTLQL